MAETKVCIRCKKSLSVDLFFKILKNGKERRAECKRCYHAKYKKSKAHQNRFIRYGISINEYHTLLEAQHGKCRICQKKDKKLLVDHCHKTGAVRGLLCKLCNNGIGMLKDNVEIVAEALRYLLKYSKGV